MPRDKKSHGWPANRSCRSAPAAVSDTTTSWRYAKFEGNFGRRQAKTSALTVGQIGQGNSWWFGGGVEVRHLALAENGEEGRGDQQVGQGEDPLGHAVDHYVQQRVVDRRPFRCWFDLRCRSCEDQVCSEGGVAGGRFGKMGTAAMVVGGGGVPAWNQGESRTPRVKALPATNTVRMAVVGLVTVDRIECGVESGEGGAS